MMKTQYSQQIVCMGFVEVHKTAWNEQHLKFYRIKKTGK